MTRAELMNTASFRKWEPAPPPKSVCSITGIDWEALGLRCGPWYELEVGKLFHWDAGQSAGPFAPATGYYRITKVTPNALEYERAEPIPAEGRSQFLGIDFVSDPNAVEMRLVPKSKRLRDWRAEQRRHSRINKL